MQKDVPVPPLLRWLDVEQTIFRDSKKKGENLVTLECYEMQLIITYVTVLDPGKGVCADPVNRGTILGKGVPDPQSRDREHQLAPDKGRGKT